MSLLDGIATEAQIRQDQWVAAMTGRRRGGIFVDIGAGDGRFISNSWMLERDFGWTGVCAEPNPDLFAALSRHRAARCVQKAVFTRSGERLSFIPYEELGTIASYAEQDGWGGKRMAFLADAPMIEVETIDPNTLMEAARIPRLFDYLSLDTEGSEWDILRAIDFSAHRFALATIEHNHVEDKRALIAEFLVGMGYQRFPAGFDDWFYHADDLAELNSERVDIDAILRWFAPLAA